MFPIKGFPVNLYTLQFPFEYLATKQFDVSTLYQKLRYTRSKLDTSKKQNKKQKQKQW